MVRLYNNYITTISQRYNSSTLKNQLKNRLSVWQKVYNYGVYFVQTIKGFHFWFKSVLLLEQHHKTLTAKDNTIITTYQLPTNNGSSFSWKKLTTLLVLNNTFSSFGEEKNPALLFLKKRTLLVVLLSETHRLLERSKAKKKTPGLTSLHGLFLSRAAAQKKRTPRNTQKRT